MNEFEAIAAFRQGERVGPSRPKVCPECKQARDDVDLFAEDMDTGESIYMCAECVAREEMACLEALGLRVAGLVKFDGRATKNCLPYGWFTSDAYGVLLADGRVMWGDREVKPPSYERVN